MLFEAEWTRESISASFDPLNQRPATPEVEEQIAARWAAAEHDAAKHHRLLFPGPLARVLRYESNEKRLNLWLGPADYRDYLGTREIEHAAFRADPLSACAVVRTSDGKILVGRRGQSSMEGAGLWHVMAGYVDPTLDKKADGIDPFATIVREIEEETGFPRGEVSAVCLALLRWNMEHKFELIFAAETPRSFRDLRPLEQEHDEFRAIDDNPQAIRAFLKEAGGHIAKSGAACLVRYAAWRYGAAL